jgi:signal transduction histidine kinase
MSSSKAGKRVNVLFYLLTFYILLQFFWWAYLLINLNSELYAGSAELNTKVWMVLGEGAVFLFFLLLGIWFMQKTIRKEINLVRQQRNFLLSITHELKTPIAAIKLCLETLNAHRDLEKEKQLALQRNALTNTERLQNLIENVLLATQIEGGAEPVRRERLNLSELCSEIIAKAEKNLGNTLSIQSEIEEGILSISDNMAIESILNNLIDNAAKYAGGTVNITLNRQGRKALLSVQDLGPGIPAEKKSEVFQKFIRLENEETRSKKGTGLGMYIVKQLVEMLQGEVRLRDNNPHGLIVEVLLPAES